MNTTVKFILTITLALLITTAIYGQNAALQDRNAVNSTVAPSSMMADSPVIFPDSGALPAQYPPDLKSRDYPSETNYFRFESPCRSLHQIAAIQAEMPKGEFTTPTNDWKNLARTHRISKGGLFMMMRELALEFSQFGITINNIAPGAIRTDMNRAVLADLAYEARVIAKTPARFIGEPADVAAAAVFLASPAARFITGATLFVDGGLTL